MRIAQEVGHSYNGCVDRERASRTIFRTIIGLQLMVLSYIVTFLLLNAPAYLKQARFAASGKDLSGSLAGQYVPLETLDSFVPPVAAQTPDGQFPYLEVSINSSVSLYPDARPSQVGATTLPPEKPKIPYVDPNVFVPYTVTVPRIGVRAPLVGIATNTEKEQQAGLARGVIHIAGTPEAGEPGNAFYAGHSSDYLFKPGQYKTVFALLPELKRGDYFIITNDKRAFYFTVQETIITGPEDTTVLTRGGGKEKMASLQTSYPVGTAKKRFVVIGQLTRSLSSSELDK